MRQPKKVIRILSTLFSFPLSIFNYFICCCFFYAWDENSSNVLTLFVSVFKIK